MNFCTTFVAHPKSPELVQPTVRAFDDPAVDAQTASVLGATFCQERLDTALPQGIPVRLRIVGTISVRPLRTTFGRARLSGDRWNR